MTVSTKKVIEVGKSKKQTFSFKADFVHFLVRRLIFWQHQRGAVVAAVNLISVLHFVFYDLQHLLISLARGLRYFHDVELLRPFDEFQRNLIFKRKHTKQKNILFIQSWFCLLFCEKVYFLTAPARSCPCCGQFNIDVTICVDVELLYPSD